ncbi:MAG: hypothetical protein ABI939_01950 [Anaerolineaceae bacterium]
MSASPPPTFTEAFAQRLVNAIALAPGVREVTVCGREGDVAFTSGGADCRKEAALARFLVQQAEAMTDDGDLRGIGRTVATSQLEQITLSGAEGDSLVVVIPDCFALVELHPGAAPANVAASIRAVARRYQ